MNTSNLKLRIKEIKSKYEICPDKIWTVPEEFTSKYGCPIDIEKSKDGFLCLFNRYWESDSFLFLFSNDFKEYKLILQKPNIFGIEYDLDSEKIFLLNIDCGSLFNKNKPQEALHSACNSIQVMDRKTGEIETLVSSSHEKAFFSFDLALLKNKITYFDFISREIKTIDWTGKILDTIPVLNHWIKKNQYDASNTLYYSVFSDNNWFNILSNERNDIIYRMSHKGQMEQITKIENFQDTNMKLNDFEILNDSLFWCSATFYGKSTLTGDLIFSQTMKDSKLWQTDVIPNYFWRLKKDRTGIPVMYGISWGKGALINAIYKFDFKKS